MYKCSAAASFSSFLRLWYFLSISLYLSLSLSLCARTNKFILFFPHFQGEKNLAISSSERAASFLLPEKLFRYNYLASISLLYCAVFI